MPVNTNLKKDSLNQNERLSSNILPDLPVSKFDRSFSHKTTFDSGKLVPVMWDEILPGDSIELNISSLIRSVVPLAPVMDNSKLTLHAFFVPNRIIWDSWKAFMGESKTAWDIPTDLVIPKVDYSSLDWSQIEKGYDTYFGVNDLSTYLGIPVYIGDYNNETGDNKDSLPLKISALPFRAYGRIWNDWYRDQNLQDEILISTNDNDLLAENITYSVKEEMDFKKSIRYGLKLAPVSKFADYFTTALPSPQRGEDTYLIDSIKKFNLQVGYPDWQETVSTGATLSVTDPDNDSSNILSINELRYAISIQHFKELDARGGTRYIEIVKNHFGVESQDLRVNRAQFLGGVSQYIQIHQVNQTTPTTGNIENVNQGLGSAGAQSITYVETQNTIKSSFTEHGLLMVMVSVRPENTYAYGLHKYWTKFTKFDFYFPTFDNIGEQPVYMSEIFYTRENEENQTIFGYQPAWADYRYKLNTVNGYFHPKASQSLYNWTYTTKYDMKNTNHVVLNADFIEQKKTNIAQTLTYQNMHQFIATFYFDYKHSRVMKVDSIPGIDRI